jgi:hypothetical protein
MTRSLQIGLPQGLKAISYSGPDGTAEAVPFPNPLVPGSTTREAAEENRTSTAAAEAAIDTRTVIAALKRCATQDQSFSAAFEAVPLPRSLGQRAQRRYDKERS